MKFNKIIGDELVGFCDNCENYENKCFCTGTIECLGCGTQNKPDELDCKNCSKYFHQGHGCSYGQPDGDSDFINECECPHN